MSAIALCMATLLAGSGLARESGPGPQRAANNKDYHVTMRLVEILPDGSRNVSQATYVPVNPGEPCQVQTTSSKEGSRVWNFRLNQTRLQGLHVTGSVTTLPSETREDEGKRTQRYSFSIDSRVRMGQISRWVQERDSEGLPLTWIEFFVEPGGQSVSTPASDNSLQEPQEVYPFYYEPF